MEKKIKKSFIILIILAFFGSTLTSCGTVDEPICGTCTTQVTNAIFQGRVVSTTKVVNKVEACGDEFSATASLSITQTKGDTIFTTKYEDCKGN